MADTENHLEKTKRKLQEKRFTTQPLTPGSGVYVFFSFDLVNSTLFKISDASTWPVIVTRFYDLVAEEITTRFTSAILWKYVGDEVLFYKKIRSRQDLHNLLPAVFDALNSVTASLHRLKPEARTILSVKATVWIGEVEYLPPAPASSSCLSKRNMIMPVNRLSDSLITDFLGPDIDIGFRISKFVERKRLIVSAHLAGLLYRERANCGLIEEQLRIVAFEPLKGVWNGRRYPIVWFEPDWNNVQSSFYYDEHFTSPLIAAVKSGDISSAQGALSNIEKVFSDLGKENELDELLIALDTEIESSADNVVEIEIPQSKYSEVHCVAVCFNSEGEILIGRRPATKKRYPNCWEFGCGQLQLGETFSDCLKRAYKEDFNAHLDLLENPVPLSTFVLADKTEQRHIPGIIFIAQIINPDDVQNLFLREKHTEVKWISLNDLAFPSSECVPNLKETLVRARELWLTNYSPNSSTSDPSF